MGKTFTDDPTFPPNYFLDFDQKINGDWFIHSWVGVDFVKKLGLNPANLDRDFRWAPSVLAQAIQEGYRISFTPKSFVERMDLFNKTLGI